eukprot:4268555-Pyramimonas_sp.AAC.1
MKTDFVIGRDQQIAAAERLGVTLPDAVKARYYEEGANLTQHMRFNLSALMAGEKPVHAVRRALLEPDIQDIPTFPKVQAAVRRPRPL